LVVAHHGVAVVPRFTRAGKPREKRVGWHASIQHSACGIEARTLFREDRQSRVHGLDDVIGSYSEAVVGWIPAIGRTLWTVEAHAESIEESDQFEGRPVTLRSLLNTRSGSIVRC
jgi:hypothetical protein